MSKGQLVEVLDDSGSNWMVITIPMATDDLQMEGFIPAQLLKQTASECVREVGGSERE